MGFAESLSQQKFHPIIKLPESYPVFDFSGDYDADKNSINRWGVGKYNELRPSMYKGEQYSSEELRKVRNIHMGIDIGAPPKTPVHAFADGRVLFAQDNAQAWDYGPTLITEHVINGFQFWLLLGHLSEESLQVSPVGKEFAQGEIIAEVGSKEVNGGWNPHIHVQVSLIKPSEGDLPGVVSQEDHSEALKIYPDPRIILGAIY